MAASQSRSSLVSLPGELRNQIFELALLSDNSIVNPYFEPSARPRHHHVPDFGVAIARTCQAMYNDFDQTPLLKHNTFVFTRVTHVHAFYAHLTRAQMRMIRSITIDLREAASGYANDGGVENADIISNEWMHYLTCDHLAHPSGVWCSKLSTVGSDIPDLRELVLDLTGWQSPFAGARRSGWKYLQRLLGGLKDMDSISLKGKCLSTSCWNPSPAPWGVGPWFSPAFGNDDTSLLELMGAVLRPAGRDERKTFTWSVVDGVTTLQIDLTNRRAQDLLPAVKLGGETPTQGSAAFETIVNQGPLDEEEASDKFIPWGQGPVLGPVHG